MNKIWIIFVLSSITLLVFTSPENVLIALNSASNKAVGLSLELMAIYAIWMGIFSILEQTGISQKFSKLLSPIVNLIFGKKNLSDESRKYISMSMSANMLGMGGAATPLGIKAMESLQKDNPNKDSATYSMTMLIIISSTVLQFLPSTIMGLMTYAGSSAPAKIILPSIITSICSTTVGVLLVKFCHFISQKTKRGKK